MTAFAAALAFVAGLLVGIRVLAALYGPLDLWYTIGTAWPVVVRRIVVWVAVAVGALAWLDGAPRIAFALGMATHLALHVVASYLIVNSYPRRPGPTVTVE